MRSSSDAGTSAVTPLFEIRPAPIPQLVAAPDGRAVVVLEIGRPGVAPRVHLFDAMNTSLVDLCLLW